MSWSYLTPDGHAVTQAMHPRQASKLPTNSCVHRNLAGLAHLHQVDPAPGGVGLVPLQQIGGAGRQAEAAVHAVVDQLPARRPQAVERWKGPTGASCMPAVTASAAVASRRVQVESPDHAACCAVIRGRRSVPGPEAARREPPAGSNWRLDRGAAAPPTTAPGRARPRARPPRPDGCAAARSRPRPGPLAEGHDGPAPAARAVPPRRWIVWMPRAALDDRAASVQLAVRGEPDARRRRCRPAGSGRLQMRRVATSSPPRTDRALALPRLDGGLRRPGCDSAIPSSRQQVLGPAPPRPRCVVRAAVDPDERAVRSQPGPGPRPIRPPPAPAGSTARARAAARRLAGVGRPGRRAGRPWVGDAAGPPPRPRRPATPASRTSAWPGRSRPRS